VRSCGRITEVDHVIIYQSVRSACMQYPDCVRCRHVHFVAHHSGRQDSEVLNDRVPNAYVFFQRWKARTDGSITAGPDVV
jgi:hypothetical protein